MNLEHKTTQSKLKPYQNALVFSQFISSQSLGRLHSLAEGDEDIVYLGALDPFFIDKNKLRLSPFLQRLIGVSQVFITSNRSNRFVHTEEVVAIATTIGRILGLNVHLIEAISLLHDFGHSFCGHLGERLISEFANREFRHEVMSVVIAQKIAREGKGLNLSYETLEGALGHSRAHGGLEPATNKPLEYGVLVIADKLACVLSDLEEAIRRGHLSREKLPPEFFALGYNHPNRIFNCIFALIKESAEKQRISFVESETAQQFEALRQWNYHNFYYPLDHEPIRVQIKKDFEKTYQSLYDLFLEFEYNPFLIFALMTDREILKIIKTVNTNRELIYKKNFLAQFPALEIAASLSDHKKINIFNADLDKKKFQKFDYFSDFDFLGD